MSELLLDENHHYTLDGKGLDGLTATIAEAGLIGNFGTKWHMDKGSAIHLATEFYDRGTLDEATVDPQIQGYLESWKQFRKDQNYTPIEIEYRIVNTVLMVASRVDRIPLLDIKSGTPTPWHILQIAFQWATLIAEHPREWVLKPTDIYLDPDGGPPKVKVYSLTELKEAYKVYCSLLYFIRWRREKYGNKNSD